MFVTPYRSHIYCRKCEAWYKPLEKWTDQKTGLGYMIMICPKCCTSILMDSTEEILKQFEVV